MFGWRLAHFSAWPILDDSKCRVSGRPRWIGTMSPHQKRTDRTRPHSRRSGSCPQASGKSASPSFLLVAGGRLPPQRHSGPGTKRQIFTTCASPENRARLKEVPCAGAVERVHYHLRANGRRCSACRWLTRSYRALRVIYAYQSARTRCATLAECADPHLLR